MIFAPIIVLLIVLLSSILYLDVYFMLCLRNVLGSQATLSSMFTLIFAT